MMISEPVLLDSNVLIYTQDQKFPLFDISTKLVKKVIEGEVKGVLAQQNLLEFYSVVTSSKRVSKPISPKKAFELIKMYEDSEFKIIFPNKETITTLFKLCKKNPLKGGKIYDAYLVATMFSNGISTVITANVNDFKGFPNIQVIDLKSL